MTGFITLKDARWTATGYEFLLPGDGDTDYPLYFKYADDGTSGEYFLSSCGRAINLSQFSTT